MAITETTGQRLAACARYSDKNGAPAMNLDDTLVDHFKSVDASRVARLRWFLAKYDLPDDTEFTSFADASATPLRGPCHLGGQSLKGVGSEVTHRLS